MVARIFCCLISPALRRRWCKKPVRRFLVDNDVFCQLWANTRLSLYFDIANPINVDIHSIFSVSTDIRSINIAVDHFPALLSLALTFLVIVIFFTFIVIFIFFIFLIIEVLIPSGVPVPKAKVCDRIIGFGAF